MSETPDMRRRVAERIRSIAAAGGMALPPFKGDPPPEDPELRARWEREALAALQEDRDGWIARSTELARQQHRQMIAQEQQARAAQARTRTATKAPAVAGPSDAEVRAVAQRLNISELAAREALEGDRT